MHRGCSSDRTDNKEKCNLLDKKCGFCHANNRNGCNNEPMKTSTQLLSCVNCKGFYNESCAWGHTIIDAKFCRLGIVWFPDKESCYLNVNRKEKIVTRGCTLDKAHNVCTFNNETQYCEKCTEHGCNNQNVVIQRCLVCNSSIEGQENCTKKYAYDFSGKCDSKTTYGYEERGCYVMNKGIG